MNLIELLRQVKPGDSVYRLSNHLTYVYRSDECMVQWLAQGAMRREVTANDWVIEGQDGANTQEQTAVVAAEPMRPEATAIANLLRQDFDTKHPDEIVREMWLAMQLLTTPECCADFIRRSLVVS
ncbi:MULTISPECIES: hypothetical protein [Serratia]|uniref:hypothetical protein n=1 Tax=Serratia TaxID=613 RepID=UPI0006611FCC|nr:hypothetical protein [Serratia sp. 506_PEND]